MACYIFYRRFLIPRVIAPRLTLVKCETNGEKIISGLTQVIIEHKILSVDVTLTSGLITMGGIIAGGVIGESMIANPGDSIIAAGPAIALGASGILLHGPLYIASIAYPVFRIGKLTLQKSLYIPKIP